MERLIRVKGKGKLSVRPDWIRLLLHMSGVKPAYEESVEASARETKTLQEALSAVGFDASALKTQNFRISAKYESRNDEKGNWRQEFVGYEFRHDLKLEFEADNARLGQVLSALARCEVRPEFEIVYTVKDPEAVKNQLIGRAVADSKEKAEALTAAAGIGLGQILNIEYAWGDMDMTVRPVGNLMMAKAVRVGAEDAMEMNIEPEDIDMDDTVTVTWQLI